MDSDASLVREALDGHSAAFTALVDRYSRQCLRFATRMLGNREDAEDVTQDAFVRAYGALARYDGQMAFQTWLMTILINRCRTSLLLRTRREARVVVNDAAVAQASTPATADDFLLRETIGAAIAQLEPLQREAFLLKHVEDLSYDEMAITTGAGVSALKMRVQRACERLQHLLGDHHE